MRKNIFILLLCLMASCWGFAQNNVIESELQTVLNQRNDDYIDINIVFKSQISSEELSSIGVTNDKSVRREKMINELKRHSQVTQKDVMSVLEAEEKNGNVIDVKSYWLTNFINCKAKSDVIYQLASRSDIELISINQEMEVVSDVTSGTESRDVQSATIAQHLTQVEADKVWELGYTGKNVIVAVLDSGVNTEHEDLKDHLWNGNAQHGYNVVNPGQAPIDDRSHGTHCAGIVCGDGTSGKITGAAPDATLMSIKLYDANSGLTLSRLTAGIQFATTYGADILSISQGWSNLSASNRTTLRNTFDNLLNLDIIAVVAAGNDRQSLSTIPAPNNVRTPGDCPPPWLHPDQTTQGGLSSVVSVGAVDSDNVVSGISSQGPVTWQGTSYNDYLYNPGMGLIRPDIAAPGNSIVSLDNETNNGYAIKSGTSMATPCVAGVMALMLEKNPELKPADLCRIIETTATKISNKKNNDTGSGVINALAAVQAVNFNTSGPYFCQYSFTKNLTFGTNQSLELTLINNGQGSTSGNTNVTISTNDAYTTIVEGSKTYGTMAAGATASATFVVSVDNLVPDNHTVTFTVSATNGNYSRTFDIDVNIDNEFVAPIVNVQANGTTVNLTWNATNNATSYNVYRDGTLHGNTTSTSYTDSGLEYATLYAYTVTSKRGELESEHSLTTRIQTGDNPETPSPTNVTANNGNITWTNATGSKGSNIYRKDYLAGSETSVATNVSGTSYTDNWNSLKDGLYQYGVSNLHAQNEIVYTENFTDLNVTSSTGVYPTMNAYWYIYRGGSGNSYNWKIDSYITNAGKRYESFSGKAAFITSNYSNSSYLSYLVTRPMDYTQYNGKVVKLSFKYITPAWGNDINTLKVMISTTSYNSGWTELWSSNKADVQGWPEQVVDLSAYVGQQFYIAFVNVAGYGYCTGVDEVSVYVENEVESRIEWSESVGKNVNMFVQDGNWSNTDNWSAKRLPKENENVIINADATIASGNVEVNSLTINEGKSLTLNSGAKLTVINDFTNTDADAFIVNDGAQVIQDNEDVAATFNMNIVNPQEWSANNTTGWQFITSPLKNARIEDFIPETSEYDLYKYDGNKNIEWLNHKDENIYDDDTEPEGPQDIIVEIGADKNPDVGSNYYLPVYDYSKYAMSQQIYTAEELGDNIGKIKSISFKLGNQRTSVTRQYEVYITSTELDAFNGNTFAAISASDKVFDGDVVIEGTQDSWYTINLDKPFNYQGGNIIITVYDKSGVSLTSTYHLFYKYATSRRALYKQGSYSYNMSNLGTGNQLSYVNQIQIGMTIGEVIIQKDIIVETGADKNPDVGYNCYLPVYDYSKYSMSQQIYTAEELGGNIGEIKSIAFKLGNQRTPVTRQYEVYITSTELNTFNGNTFAAISASDKVFDGDVVIEGTQDSWYTINLDKPFNYQGGNIIITVYDKSGFQLSMSEYHTFYKYVASGRALYKQGSSSYNMSNLGTGTQQTYVSQVRFGIFVTIDSTPAAPQNLYATATSSTSVSLTWNASSLSTGYNIYQGNIMIASGITGNTYSVEGLSASTEYCFNVTAVNEVGESEATEACATTLEEGAAVISIGEGTIVQMAAPVYDAAGYNYSLSQQIFTKAEIGLNSASISSISFHQAAGNNNVRNITVYMQNVDKTSFSGNYDWITFSDSDIVYQGEFNFGTAGEWVTIEFPETFEYTGGNIAVSVYDQTGTNFGYEYAICDKFYNSEIADWRGMFYTNANSINVSNLSSLYGSKMNTGNWGTPANVYYINNIKLAYLTSKSDVKSSQNITDINGGFVSAKNQPVYNGTELGGGSNQFESTFQQGVGYMASYESENIATFKGTLSHEKSYTFEVKYNDKKELANFHLLGNPFTFDMNWNNVNASGLASGYAVVNENGGYDYSSTGTIKVGDGFFVKAVSKDASLSYNGNLTKRSETVNEEVRFINIITSDKNGKDNVVINLTDEEQEGFPKISNLNESIANVYVPYNDKCYGVYNCNNDVKEVEVYFEAKKMGNYTISAVTEGNFESVVLLDRFTGKETNMLLNDYDFTATAQDAINRFVVRFVIAQPSTINSNFAYQSGEELVITTEGAVQILDIMGRLVYSNNVVSDNNRINISKLSKTAYIVRLINENGVNTQKVVIY